MPFGRGASAKKYSSHSVATSRPEIHYPRLRPADINLRTDTLSLLTLKKMKYTYRTVSLHPYLKEATIQNFLENHIDPVSESAIFPMQRQTVDQYLGKIQDSVGFRVHAHKFRHTFAAKALLGEAEGNHLTVVPFPFSQSWIDFKSCSWDWYLIPNSVCFWKIGRFGS